MSAQRRSSKPSFLARLFCCVSPEQEAPTSSRPPAAPQGQQQVLLPARDEPAAAAGTQAARAGDAPAGTIAGQEGEEKKHSASLANDEGAVIGSREVGHESAASQAAVRPSEGDRVVSRPDDTIPPVGLAPALAQDAQGVAIISPDTSQTSSALLAEEKVALADDEPLTPSSASIAATVPIANTVDFSHSPQVGDDEQEFESWLLPPLSTLHHGKKCLVLDLDETLVHSSFKADFVVPVEIDGIFHNVYVIKRPGVDDFMQQMGEHFEIVVFTASLAKYADPVLDMLDIHKVVHHRLFRESCHNHMGNYVKDLSQLGRDLKDAIIIDNSPASYIFHPAHAVPISSWFNDVHDTELTDLIPFLIDLTTVDDVSQVLDLSI